MNFEDVKLYCDDIRGSMSSRTTMFDAMEKMYLMDADTGLESMPWIKKTISPDPRNKLVGAVRLLTATDPKFRAPTEENDVGVRDRLSEIERAARAMWKQSGRARLRPVHYDLALTALLYGEAHVVIKDTSELVKVAKTPGEKRRAEEIARRTPIIYDVLNPKYGFPVVDQFGMRAYYTKQNWRVVDVIAKFGDIQELSGRKPTETVEYNEFWDADQHVVWLTEMDQPLIQGKHDWPIIPIVGQICEGSPMFSESGQQSRQPLLYSLWKSNLWDRQNLSLTLLYSLAFVYGANPSLIYKSNDPNKRLDIDFSVPGGLITVENNEDVQQMVKQAIDPSISQGLSLAKEFVEEMTVYGQALGEPLGANAPYSMVALLSQAGRLPLVPYQRMLSWIISEATRVAFARLRESTKSYTLLSEKGVFTLEPELLKDDVTLEIEALLDLGLPQDDRQMVTVAMQATSGEKPLVSHEYARQNWLGIDQSDDMDEAIWSERQAYLQATMEFEKMKMQAQLQFQQQHMAMQQQPGPQPGQQLPPEVVAAMAAQGGGSGMMPQPGMGGPTAAGIGEGLPMEGPMDTSMPPEGGY